MKDGRGAKMGRRKRNAVNSRRRISDEKDECLLPGLLDEIVLDHVVPKLPWQALYILSLVNRSWLEANRSRRTYEARVRSDSTEMFYVISLDCPGTLCLCPMSNHFWRELPQFPGYEYDELPTDCQYISGDGKLYVLGGWSSDEEGGEVYVLDIAGQRQWKQCAKMPIPRHSFGCGVVGGKIYVYGGFIGCDSRKPARKSLVYDPEANVWSSIRPMKRSSSTLRVVALGKELFVHSDLAGIEVYHVEKDEWRSLEPWQKHLDKKDKWIRLHEWQETEYLFSETEKLFTAQGKLHMATPAGIYVHGTRSEGDCSWTLLHSYDGFDESYNEIGGRGPHGEIQSIDVLAGNGELVALVTYEYASSVYECQGFGSEEEVLEWDIVSAGIVDVSPFMCSVHL
ncbi:unnamed protein product [Calypogeia fissa]